MNELLNDELIAEVAANIVGVIDLCNSHAVHAIAGDRANYRSVEFCDGDAIALAAYYRQLGLAGLYIADLDAIIDGAMQVTILDALCTASRGEVLVDMGWTGDESQPTRDAVAALAEKHPSSLWIAASESMRSKEALAELAAIVSPTNVLLGLDYRRGALVARTGDEQVWVRAATALDCRGFVILDLASVGTNAGPATIETCRRVKQASPHRRVYSGGGVRTAADVRLLAENGCDRCLVATALHPRVR